MIDLGQKRGEDDRQDTSWQLMNSYPGRKIEGKEAKERQEAMRQGRAKARPGAGEHDLGRAGGVDRTTNWSIHPRLV